jgi:hypothetical protein
MKKFEYRLLETESSFFKGLDYKLLNEQLNQLGNLGWEVATTAPVTAAGTTTGLLITLKRELPQ